MSSFASRTCGRPAAAPARGLPSRALAPRARHLALATASRSPRVAAPRASPARASRRAASASRHLSSRGGARANALRPSAAGLRASSPPSARRAVLGRPRGRRPGMDVLALVNVDLGPSAVLGASVMVSAIGLYQVRASRPEVSRDQDVFFSSVGLLTGGILVFQGWRLDPLMLFGQLLTAATAMSFASEAIGLRQEILDREAADEFDREGPDAFDARRRRRRGGGDPRYAGSRDARGGDPRSRHGPGNGGGGGGGGPPRGGGGSGSGRARRRPAPLPPPGATRTAPYDQWREIDVDFGRGDDASREAGVDFDLDFARGGFADGFADAAAPGPGPARGPAARGRERGRGPPGPGPGPGGGAEPPPRRDRGDPRRAEFDDAFRPGRFGSEADDWD